MNKPPMIRDFEQAQAVTLDAFSIVDALAELNPQLCPAMPQAATAPDQWPCNFCGEKFGKHADDCLWLSATLNKAERTR